MSLAVAVVAIVVHCVPGAAGALEYDRAALARGEVWRWLTGHLAHFDASHLAWDVATLVGLGAVAERRSSRPTAVALLAAALAVSAAVWLFQPWFHTYRGLSGLACALGGLIAADLLLQSRPAARMCGAMVVGFVAVKGLYELRAGAPVFARAGGYAPVPLAHFVGFALGAASSLSAGFTSRRRTRG